ncbi:hypothetical protein DITRI_Ditri07aG0080800 [Diplodiscus trichospermus]
MDSDWERLPRDLVDLILQRFGSLSDYFKFGAACKAWYSAALETINCMLPQQLPMLMVSNDVEDIWNLYSIKEKKLLPLQLPVPYKKPFVGSSYGWLVTMEEDFSVSLLNPFYLVPGKKGCNPSAFIALPPVQPPKPNVFWAQYSDYHIHKAVLSANPVSSPDDYMVMVIFGAYFHLAFIRPSRDKEWTYVSQDWRQYGDAIYYQDHFYAVDQNGRLLYCDVTDKPIFKYLPSNQPQVMDWSKKYLVKSILGELLLVERIKKWTSEEDSDHPIEIKVWKLIISCEGSKWMEIKSIGDSALFLGDNNSSVIASNFPGCHPNSIYFTDLGVYDMETGSFTPHYTTDNVRRLKMARQRPIWIVPPFKPK